MLILTGPTSYLAAPVFTVAILFLQHQPHPSLIPYHYTFLRSWGEIPPPPTTPLSGTLYLDIYYAKSSQTAGLYIADTTTRLARASISHSELSTDIYTSVATSFTFDGDNAVDLTANTRYAFYLNLTSVSFPSSSQLLCQWNTSSTYSGGNFFGTNFSRGISDIDIAGQIDVTYAAVPEPGTMILFGVTMAIGGAAAVIRKRRKRNAD
jgi:hypothetical protein